MLGFLDRDIARHIQDGMVEAGITVSPSFVALNRNKRSMAINLAGQAGQSAVRRMVAQCDVVVKDAC